MKNLSSVWFSYRFLTEKIFFEKIGFAPFHQQEKHLLL